MWSSSLILVQRVEKKFAIVDTTGNIDKGYDFPSRRQENTSKVNGAEPNVKNGAEEVSIIRVLFLIFSSFFDHTNHLLLLRSILILKWKNIYHIFENC